MVPTDKTPFTLRRATGTLADGAAKLAGEIGSTSVEAVLAQANRLAVKRGASAAMGTMQPRPAEWYAFDQKDNDTPDWYPQGLTCGEDSGQVGVPVFVASWYFKPLGVVERGIRISFLSPQTLKYQHALLVEAKPDGSYGPINIHAGGIAWYGDLLYVADTTRGLRVFDMNHLLDLRTVQKDLGDAKLIGRQGGRFNAFGYRYLLPQTDAWRLAASGPMFSFVSVDRSASPDLLVAGEYLEEGSAGRIARWSLDDMSLVDAFAMGQRKIQGGMSFKGRWYLSQAANAATNGRLLVDDGSGKVASRPFPLGPEDLCMQGGRLWSVTEFRNKRVIFGVSL
ncbi:hypothetical protein ACIBG8_34610 [Nonomuraea sp. NPDC050556]|uniref:hypothetical protein n=1 Tax=Nonomuraea sp. NPDC050556 TaxID=3364369 RepID=UPI0037A0960E